MRGWNQLSEREIIDCEEHCRICAHIKSEVWTKDWCFKWLEDLENMESGSAEDGGHFQVYLQPKLSDETVSDIRAKLADLQTRMPAWTLLDYIKEEAVELASRESSDLLVQKYQKSVPVSCSCMGCQHPEELMNLSQTRNATLKLIQNNLKAFVQKHVYFLLTELYDRLNFVEKMIAEENPNESRFQSWFRQIYIPQPVPNVIAEDEYDPQQIQRAHHSNLTIVGPVGERPVHVCALSAHRFNDVDFEKMGNYVQDGITRGLKQYFEAGQSNSEEMCVRYGKDYCAAIGSFLKARLPDHQAKDLATMEKLLGKMLGEKFMMPPFWKKIARWYKDHRDSKLRCCLFPFAVTNEQKDDMVKVATVGLYEGETVIYPMIAGGDLDTVNWMLLKTDNTPPRDRMSGATTAQQSTRTRCVAPGGFPTIILLLSMSAAASQICAADGRSDTRSLALLPVDGLFFRPIRRHQLTSFGVLEGWKYYMNVRFRDENLDASSPKSYFGRNVLSFAVSQGNVEIFDLIFYKLETLLIEQFSFDPKDFRDSKSEQHTMVLEYFSKMESNRDAVRANLIRRALLDTQDEYGNTLLHLAAWNGKKTMYDRLIQMGARDNIKNYDGVNSFGLTARYGMWSMFHHIWKKHLTATAWRFGNVEKAIVDYSSFDWKGLVTFHNRSELRNCLVYVTQLYEKHIDAKDEKFLDDITRSDNYACANSERITRNVLSDLQRKVKVAQSKVQQLKEWHVRLVVMQHAHRVMHNGDEYNHIGKIANAFGRTSVDAMSVVRMITLFRPTDWYNETKGEVEDLILRKWAQGHYLIHMGQNVIPFLVVLVIFCMMWYVRQIDVLEHNFWWADSRAASMMKTVDNGALGLLNPVRANVSELQLTRNKTIFGIDGFSVPLLPKSLFGPEHECGWKAIRSSYSGQLQAVLFLYSVPCLLRLAWTQKRIRASDLDGSQDMKISFEEVVNFIYFNLESLLHTVMCGLFITIVVERVRAGEQCAVERVRGEKNATAIACLFLFLNLFVSCKPYKGLGFLILTIYKFLVSDVFNFLVMYCMFFAGFLLALQTIHNANHAFLAWVEYTTSIVPQIQAVTEGMAFMANANVPSSATRIGQSRMAIDGCQVAMRTIYDTAFSLLEISFGDGLADALQQARGNNFECAGFTQDRLVGFILVFWVFLTNVLVLNMLIAMMNSTMDRQEKQVHHVWLLDVSYRIMRYEQLFPELVRRLQVAVERYSLWSLGYWQRALLNTCLAIYCCPEIHTLCMAIDQVWLFFTRRQGWWRAQGSRGTEIRNLHETAIRGMMNYSGASARKRASTIGSTLFQGSTNLSDSPTGGKPHHERMDRIEKAGRKVVHFARRNGVFNQVERWRQEIENLKIEGRAPAPEEEDRLTSLYLVEMISQLDTLLNSFDTSLSIHRVNVLDKRSG